MKPLDPLQITPITKEKPLIEIFNRFDKNYVKQYIRKAQANTKSFPTNDYIGVEIEVETIGMFINRHDKVFIKYWKATRDHSLKVGGVEYIFKDKLKGIEIKKALETFESLVNPKAYIPSYRTSVHIHIDMSDFTPIQIFQFYTLYLLLEEVIISYVDKERDSENFCMSYYYTLGHGDLYNYLKSLFNLQPINDKPLAYTSLTPTKIKKYQTLEFRIMSGTYESKKILSAIRILMRIKKFIRKHKHIDIMSLRLIQNAIVDNRFEELILTVFEKQGEYIVRRLGLDEIKEYILNNINIPYEFNKLVTGDK